MSRIKKIIISVTKEAEKLDPLYTDCRTIKWNNDSENSRKFLKMLNIDPVIPLPC